MTKNMILTRTPKWLPVVRRSRLALTGALCMLLGGSVPVAAQPGYGEAASIEAVLLRHGVGSIGSGRRVISAWNELAYDIAFAEDQFLTFKGQRALAMMHLAMHDAVNSIVPVYERYAYAGPRVIAHPVVGAAQAAYEVLVSQYPDQQQRLAAEREVWLGQIPQRSASRTRHRTGPCGCGCDPRASGRRWMGPARQLRVPQRSRAVPNDAAVERVRCTARLSIREALRFR